MLADKSIDAVCISTPDHWHAQPAMEAALAGKDIYLQKPASLTIAEGRQMADVVKRTGRILQHGSQQRSDIQFRLACELIRNGRIGKIKEVFIGLPEDPSGNVEPEMPVPANLNYEKWLGSTPLVYYTENRVHPAIARHPQTLRPSRLAALRAVRRRHDHGLGRAPHRYRALGHGYGTLRTGGRVGHRPVPHEGTVGRSRAVSRARCATPMAPRFT